MIAAVVKMTMVMVKCPFSPFIQGTRNKVLFCKNYLLSIQYYCCAQEK